MLAARRVLLLALALTFAAPAVAAAAFSVSGTWEEIGDNRYRFTVRNDGDPWTTLLLSPIAHSGCTIEPPGSCGPNGDDQIRYSAGRTVATGETLTGEFTTTTPLAAGTVLKARVRMEGTESDDFDIPQKAPPRAEPRADLEVSFSTRTPSSWPGYALSQKGRTAVQILTVTVANRGPDAAADVVLAIDGRRLPGVRGFELYESRPRLIRDASTGLFSTEYDWAAASDCERPRPTVHRCRFGTLPAGERRSKHVLMLFTRRGAVEVGASVITSTRDPGPGRNTATFTSTIVAKEISDIGPIDLEGRDTFSGRASAPVRVELAVVHAEDGATVGPRTTQNGDARCRWLRLNGALKIEHDDRCDEPVWLRARGRGRFRLKLQKKLAAGSYRLIARTVGDDGTHGIGRRAVRSFRIR